MRSGHMVLYFTTKHILANIYDARKYSTLKKKVQENTIPVNNSFPLSDIRIVPVHCKWHIIMQSGALTYFLELCVTGVTPNYRNCA